MDAFGVLKLIIWIAAFDFAFCSKYCDREFTARNYIPMFAEELSSTNLKVQLDHKVKCGETVSLLQMLNTPTLKYNVKGKCDNVTVLAFSPDLVINPPYPYWVVFNVPSSALKNGFNNGGDITDKLAGRSNLGDVVAPYIAPDDPASQVRGLTVIYFIYCQHQYISDKRVLDRIDRLHFDVKSYMKDHGLNCPVAGTFHHVTVTGLPAPDLPVEVAPLEVPIPPLPYGSKLPVDLPVTDVPV